MYTLRKRCDTEHVFTFFHILNIVCSLYVCTCGGQRSHDLWSLFFHFPMWVLGIECRSSDLVARAFTCWSQPGFVCLSVVSFAVFEAESLIAQADFEPAMWWRMALNSLFTCLSCPSAGIQAWTTMPPLIHVFLTIYHTHPLCCITWLCGHVCLSACMHVCVCLCALQIIYSVLERYTDTTQVHVWRDGGCIYFPQHRGNRHTRGFVFYRQSWGRASLVLYNIRQSISR